MTQTAIDYLVFFGFILLGIISFLLAPKTLRKLEEQRKLSQLKIYRVGLFLLPFVLIFIIILFLRDHF